jgi:hypothetical protein
MAVRNPSETIINGSVDNSPIGGTTPSTGTFTTITGQTANLTGGNSNLISYSQFIGGGNWVPFGTASSTQNSAIAPDSTTTASTITNATGTTYVPNTILISITVTANTTYTFSCYIKAGTATAVGLGARDNTSGTDTLTSFTPTTAWQRFSKTFTTGTTASTFNMYLGGANGTFYAWGAQVNPGLSATTYLATTANPVYSYPYISFNGNVSVEMDGSGNLILQPSGTGALQAQQTTSSATGGNARGANAVDWQTSRTAATMVASAQAVIAGGQNNTASGTASSALGGYTNLVNANYATAVGGSYGTTRGVIGLVSIPASNQPLNVTTAGSTQSSMLVIGVQTTNATATALKSNTSAASATNQLVLPNGQTSTVSVYTFRALVSAHNTGTTDAAGWEIKGVISRGAAAANTALVGTPGVALLGATTGAITAGWGTVSNVAAVADTTNGALQIQVTGAASTTINWSATIETNELGY